MTHGRVDRVEDVLNVGDEVRVKVIDIDEKGKVSLDRLDKPEAPAGSGSDEGFKGNHRERRERGDRPGRPRRDHGDRPRRPGDNGGRTPRRHHEG